VGTFPPLPLSRFAGAPRRPESGSYFSSSELSLPWFPPFPPFFSLYRRINKKVPPNTRIQLKEGDKFLSPPPLSLPFLSSSPYPIPFPTKKRRLLFSFPFQKLDMTTPPSLFTLFPLTAYFFLFLNRDGWSDLSLHLWR